jgi:hypothetical protein
MCYVVRSVGRWGLWVSALGSLMLLNFGSPAQARSAIGRQYAYPDQVVQTYLDACGGRATDRVSQPVVYAVCVCTIDEFQTTFSLTEFRELGQAIQAGREVPAMDQIMLDCARQVMLRDNG